MSSTSQRTASQQAELNRYARRLRAALDIQEDVKRGAWESYLQRLQGELVRSFICLIYLLWTDASSSEHRADSMAGEQGRITYPQAGHQCYDQFSRAQTEAFASGTGENSRGRPCNIKVQVSFGQ